MFVKNFAFALILVASLNALACSGDALRSASPTAPSVAGAYDPPPAATSGAPVVVPPTAPVPDPEPEAPTPTPEEVEFPLTRISTPHVEYLRFSQSSFVDKATMTMAFEGAAGLFWNDRGVIVETNFTNREFRNNPNHKIALLLGNKPGYVIVGTNERQPSISASNGALRATLWDTNPEHAKITKTTHVTVVFTVDGLDLSKLAPDGTNQLSLNDPRIVAYATEKKEITWVKKVATK